MKRLFLDDVRIPLDRDDWTIVRNYEDFVNEIKRNGLPDFVSFDHDLEEDVAKSLVESGLSKTKVKQKKKLVKSGYDCALWLCDYCMDNGVDLPKFQVHSMNPVGKENITALLKSFEKISK